MLTFNAIKIESYRCLIYVFVIFNGNLYSTTNAVTQSQLDTIFLRLFNGSTSVYKDTNVNHADDLVYYLDASKPTAFYIHGFTENVEKISVLTVVDAYIWRNDHNIIAVDWSKIAGLTYLEVAASVDQVGKRIAIAIQSMLDAGLQKDKIHIVGHSMGAHIMGKVGKCIPDIPKMFGLDPAGPFATYIRIIDTLSSTDAKNVVIIHTDAGVYGINYSIGTADFWPNHGKRIQPSCPVIFVPLSTEDFCSHHLSWVFYAESLRNEKAFLGVKYSELGQPCSASVVMGYATPPTASGDYYLITASKSPFGLGAAGAKC